MSSPELHRDVARASIGIRAACDSDTASIARVYAAEVAAGLGSYEYTAPTPGEMLRRWQSLVTQGYPYLVAQCDGELAGYAYASGYRAREGYRWSVEDTVYVAPVFQGRGVGGALLGTLIDECTRRGYRQMIAVIGDRSNTASIALHRRHGFEVAGVFPGIGFKHGRWLENVQMLRPLGDGATTLPR